MFYDCKDVILAASEAFLSHAPADDSHPENPERLRRLVCRKPLFPQFESRDRTLDLTHLPEWIAQVHDGYMIDHLEAATGNVGHFDADTYYSAKSVETAGLAAAACRELALDIWKGKYRRGFAICRPPGHHATAKRPMGFCLLNNIAIAVKSVLLESPGARLAVVDFDLHHGNGTQDAFYENQNVLFVSSHRFPFYPGTGHYKEIGDGKGKGTTLNLPLPEAYGDGFFFSLYEQIVIPALVEFQPEMIFVSAGFDGHIDDPMRGLSLTTQGYQILTEMLVSAAEEICAGKIFFALEGGYNPAALIESIDAVVDMLLTLPRRGFEISVTGDAHPLIDQFRRVFVIR